MVYFIINCADCRKPIGKKYLTYNQFLVNNRIEFAIITTNIIIRPFKLEEFVKERKNQIATLKKKANSVNLNVTKLEVVDFSQSFLVLNNVLNSLYAVHKNRMKKILKRIKKLEETINQMVNFLSKIKFI